LTALLDPRGPPGAAPASYGEVVLRIDRAIYEAIIAHARRDHPDEACGVVAGPEGSDSPERFVPMTNAARSPTFFEFESREWFELDREMRDRSERTVVIYHSHTATEAYPSRSDIRIASTLGEPEAHYVLASTRDSVEIEFRSFRIMDGEVTEEEVEIV
jgi:proteasome lid subunit RPN8/RPN11